MVCSIIFLASAPTTPNAVAANSQEPEYNQLGTLNYHHGFMTASNIVTNMIAMVIDLYASLV